MDKNEFSMESRRMKALAWVYSWMNGHITDWAKVVAFANVGDFRGFEEEIKRQMDCYYPSEQSRAWFHALRLVTKEDVEEFLSLGVQSPAPDEKDAEIAKLKLERTNLCATISVDSDLLAEKDVEIATLKKELEEAKIYLFKILEEPAMKLVEDLAKFLDEAVQADCPMITKWALRINGGEEEMDVLNIWAATTHESPITRCKELRMEIDSERINSAKLIEALEEKMDRLGENSIDWNASFHPVQAVLQEMRDLIAAYKGKEGGA